MQYMVAASILLSHTLLLLLRVLCASALVVSSSRVESEPRVRAQTPLPFPKNIYNMCPSPHARGKGMSRE